jgi:hypothetical protein
MGLQHKKLGCSFRTGSAYLFSLMIFDQQPFDKATIKADLLIPDMPQAPQKISTQMWK